MAPRLLFLCQNLPYPPTGGTLIRSFHTLRLLSREFDVTALCFVRSSTKRSDHSVTDSLEALSGLGEVEAFPIPQEHSPLRLFADHLRSVLGWRAYTRWVYESEEFRKRLGTLLRERDFDLVHVDSLDLVAYLDDLAHLPVVLAHHNVESQLLRRRAETVGGLKGRYIGLQAHLTREEEARWCPRVELNHTVSDEDRATLQRITPGSECLVVPNGVETSFFTPQPDGEKNGITFVGGATWFPNLDGMRYFASEILPLVREVRPDVQVTWVGRSSEDVRLEMDRHGVQTTGFVDDIRPYVHRAACFIVPLRVGGGTRLKILDAWAMGKALVSTSQGCEGLDVRDEENILIRDSNEGFARAVIGLLEDEELRRRIGTAARKTAETTYDWEVVGRRINDAALRLVESSRTGHQSRAPQ